MCRTTSAKAARWRSRAGRRRPRRSAGTWPLRPRAMRTAAAAISRCRAAEAPGYAHVVASRDSHVDPGTHFSAEPDFSTSWPRHCVAGTVGAQFHPNFDTSRVETVFSKGAHAAAYSGFEGTDEAGAPLGTLLRKRDVDALDVVGIATDYCVRATALDAVQQGLT